MSVPTDQIRVLVADDENAVREAMRALLDADADVTVVGAAGDADEAIEMASRERPDVALVDVRMPAGGGPRAAREIARRSPDTRVIAVSAYEDAESILRMLRAGATGFIAKGGSTDELLDAVHRHTEDAAILSSGVTPALARVLAGQVVGRRRREERRRERSDRIRTVLRGEGLSMVYQPIFDLTNGRAIGAEALARFDNLPRRPPDEWFAEARAVGMQVELECVAIRRALRPLDRLRPGAFLSINVSPTTCGSPKMHRLLADVPADRLVLEITEHAPVEDYETLDSSLAPLRDRGARLAIDDAGAGFASLRHVTLLRPDLIKLDHSLTWGANARETMKSLVAALVRFASEIGAQIIAEGVETASQLQTLRDVGVPCAQGYYLGRPASIPAAGTFP